MLIIPAIGIKNGNCIRLIQGDPERETVYSKDPAGMALRFQEKRYTMEELSLTPPSILFNDCLSDVI